MSDSVDRRSDAFTEPRFELNEELPPVKPPSAGFIVQLFLIPALIVAAVVGVWALFGKMAAGEQDWRELVDEIKNTNEHRRWRGANGLATADFNRDGYLDVAVANYNSDSISILLGNGDGTFQEQGIVHPGSNPSDLTAADKIGRASCRERV